MSRSKCAKCKDKTSTCDHAPCGKVERKVPRRLKKVWIVEDGLMLPLSNMLPNIFHGFFYTHPSTSKPHRFKQWVRKGEETRKVVGRLRRFIKTNFPIITDDGEWTVINDIIQELERIERGGR